MSDAEDDGDWGGDDGDDGDFDGEDDGGKKKKKASPKKAKKETKKKEPKKKAEKKEKAPSKRKASSASPSDASPSPAKRAKIEPSPSASASSSAAVAAAAPAPSAVPTRTVIAAAPSALSGMSTLVKPGESVSDAKAKPLLLQYLTQQNRPYSHLQVWENLHRAIKKMSVPKLLDALEAEGKVTAKNFAKTKIYMIAQDPNAQIDQKELDAMDEQIATLTDTLTEEAGAVRELEAAVSGLAKAPTNAEADAQIAALEKEVAAKADAVKRLAGGGAFHGEVFTQAQVDAIQQSFNANVAKWKLYKRAVTESMGPLTDDLPAKNRKSAVKKKWEDVGIETDEEASVDIAKFLPHVKALPKGAAAAAGKGSMSANGSASMQSPAPASPVREEPPEPAHEEAPEPAYDDADADAAPADD